MSVTAIMGPQCSASLRSTWGHTMSWLALCGFVPASLHSVLMARNIAKHLANPQVMTVVPCIWAAHIMAFIAHEDVMQQQRILGFRTAPRKANLANAIIQP